MMFRPTHSPGKEWIATVSIIAVIVGLSVLSVGAVGYLLGVYSTSPNSPTVPPEEEVMCTMEALQCPDGSYVGRQGPSCSFAPCPETENPLSQQDWNEFIEPNTTFRFRYPPTWSVVPMRQTPSSSLTKLIPPEASSSGERTDYRIEVVSLVDSFENYQQDRLEQFQDVASGSGTLRFSASTVRIGNLPTSELSYTLENQEHIAVISKVSSQSAILFSGPNLDRQTVKAILASFVFF